MCGLDLLSGLRFSFYLVDHLERGLRSLGFRSFVKTQNGQTGEIKGLRLTILALTTPGDGPIGDSALIVDDGQHKLLNQNDAHPTDIEALQAMGPFDAHFLQHSGAIWFPMVYRFPPKVKDALGRQKRKSQPPLHHRRVAEVRSTG